MKVHTEFFFEKDQEYADKHDVMHDRPVFFEIELKTLMKVEDVYKDRTFF